MNTRRAALMTPLIAVALMATSSCTPTATPAPTATPNTGRLILTAFAYSPPKNTPKLVVSVKSVEAQFWTSDAREAKWVKLVDSPPAFDLALAGTQHTLAMAGLTPGGYVETKVILEKLLVSVDGRDTEIALPGSTYYLGTPFGIVTGEETVVTLSFDVQLFEPVRRGSIVRFQPYSSPPFSAVLLTTREPAEWPYKTPWWHRPTQTALPMAQR